MSAKTAKMLGEILRELLPIIIEAVKEVIKAYLESREKHRSSRVAGMACGIISPIHVQSKNFAVDINLYDTGNETTPNNKMATPVIALPNHSE